MRLLANENLPRPAVTALREHGHDVLWVRTECPGATDVVVLDLARRENRLLLTFDKDFGKLAFRSKSLVSAGVVLFRVAPRAPDYVARIVVAALAAKIDWVGHFSVVEEGRIRSVPLPPSG